MINYQLSITNALYLKGNLVVDRRAGRLENCKAEKTDDYDDYTGKKLLIIEGHSW
jgi:hypothetical protein